MIRECLVIFVGEGRQVKHRLSPGMDDEMLLQHIYIDHRLRFGEMKILLPLMWLRKISPRRNQLTHVLYSNIFEVCPPIGPKAPPEGFYLRQALSRSLPVHEAFPRPSLIKTTLVAL